MANRKEAAAAQGLRPLTAAERRKLGFPKTNRDYTRQRAGVQRLRRDMVVPRREAERAAVGTFETHAVRAREQRGMRGPMDRYQRMIYRWMAGDERTGRAPQSYREAQKDPLFKWTYKRATKDTRRGGHERVRGQRREEAQSRLLALHDLGEFTPDEWDEILERSPDMAA